MTQQIIITTPVNSGDGTPIANAFTYCNDNFSELYSRAQPNPPSTLVGNPGDAAGMYAYDSTYFYYCFANYTGNTTIWAQITQAGNISVSAINNGNSNVSISGAGANATVSIRGVSNVAVFSTTGLAINGTVSATGNVRGINLNTTGQVSAAGNITGNYIFGNGSQLTGLPATYGNSNVATYLPTYTGNVGSGNLLSTGQVSAAGNITGNNISAASVISATGNIVTAGYFVGNFQGNITGNLVVPGANTQVLFNTNGNSDAVAGMTYNKGDNTFIVLGTVSSQGNTIGGNILTAGLVSSAGNVYAGNLISTNVIVTTSSATGNVIGGNILTTGIVSTSGNISASGNVRGGNIVTAGLVSTTGNIIGSYIFANVDLTAGANLTSTNVNASFANISGNTRSGNVLTTGLISATGNITGNYFIGNGSQLTGVPSTYGNSNVAIFLNDFGSNTISTTGNITSGNISTTNNITSGNVSATGNISAANLIASGTGFINSGTGAQAEMHLSDGVATSYIIGVGTGLNTWAGAGSLDFITSASPGANIGFFPAQNEAGRFTTAGLSVIGFVSAGGNVVGANITTAGLISATGNISGNVLSVNSGNTATAIVNAGGNGVGNIGTSSSYFNTVFAKATSAQYADLAECYLADADYAPGTVLCFGGSAEVTQCNSDACATIAGVVSTHPAYQMNSGLTGDHVVSMALMGRVPCAVQGPIARGDMLVSAGNGRARAEKSPAMGTVIGKALESFNGDIGTIEIVVGRL